MSDNASTWTAILAAMRALSTLLLSWAGPIRARLYLPGNEAFRSLTTTPGTVLSSTVLPHPDGAKVCTTARLTLDGLEVEAHAWRAATVEEAAALSLPEAKSTGSTTFAPLPEVQP